jgi:hypothetical protein
MVLSEAAITSKREKTGLFRVDGERSFTLAICAVADFHFLGGVLVKRAQDGTAFLAVEFDVFELREDARPSGDHTGYTNEVVQISRAEVTERGAQREVGDADVHLRVDAFVVGVVNENGCKCDLVKNLEHCGGRVGEEVGEDGLR